MSELLRRDFIAALAPQGAPNVDIVVTDQSSTHLCSIQVKTRRDIGSDGGWHMKDKHENIRGGRLFYCFVDFGKPPSDRPSVYVIPSNVVSDVLKASHKQWLSKLGRDGQPHKDGPMRRLKPDYAKDFDNTTNPYPVGWLDRYRDAWDLLKLSPDDVDQEHED